MHFDPWQVYLLHNSGNNGQPIFFNRDNYSFFLRKIRAEWLPVVDILSYCLMPDQFKFLVVPGKIACKNIIIKEKETHLQVFSKAIGKTLSSYTKAINLEQFRTGNLFRKKTKAKLISQNKLATISFVDYLNTNIYEIHHIPVFAGLVKKAAEWQFSSAREYAGLASDNLCNKALLKLIVEKWKNLDHQKR
jgi:putative transposase